MLCTHLGWSGFSWQPWSVDHCSEPEAASIYCRKLRLHQMVDLDTKRPWTVTAQLRMLGWEWPRVGHRTVFHHITSAPQAFFCEDKPNHTHIVPVMLKFVTVRKCLLSVILSVCFDGINLWPVISSSSKGQIGCSKLLGQSWCSFFLLLLFFESEKDKANLAKIFYRV